MHASILVCVRARALDDACMQGDAVDRTSHVGHALIASGFVESQGIVPTLHTTVTICRWPSARIRDAN
jgi:hypothetical protein